MSEENPSPEHSITPKQPEVIRINEEPTPPKHPKRTLFLSILGMLLLIVGIAGWKTLQIQKAIAMGKAFRMPPDAVTTISVTEEVTEPTIEAVGSLSSPKGVMISADLPGIVTEIDFDSGKPATNGQLLVQLDTKQEQAQLRTAKAKLELARQNLDRAIDLKAKKVIAQYEYDQAKSVFDSATSTVDEIEATIARKTIRAPFDGFLGIRQVNLGQYLKSGDPIVQLESLDPIYVNFALPQQWVGSLKEGESIRVRADGLPEKPFTGTITAINSMVDPSTRNIQVQGTIPNPQRLLRSGMFAGVQVVLPRRTKVIMIPSSSVQYAPYGDSVFVIEAMKDQDGKEYLGAREQRVTLGKTRGDQIEVVGGLKAGDQIATSGIFKLRQGGAVKVNNAVQPENNPAPKPSDS